MFGIEFVLAVEVFLVLCLLYTIYMINKLRKTQNKIRNYLEEIGDGPL